MIEGSKVTLRLFTKEDLDEYVRRANVLAEQSEHLEPELLTPESMQKRYDEKQGWWGEHEGALVIADQEGALVGMIGFFKRRHDDSGYEIGYLIPRRKDRGKGYGTEALRLLSAWLFDLKPVPRLQIVTTSGNVAARRIAEKCGYRVEGTMREAAFVRGRYVDTVMYSLLRAECPALREVVGGCGKAVK